MHSTEGHTVVSLSVFDCERRPHMMLWVAHSSLFKGCAKYQDRVSTK